jgi:hypothetical protein
VEEGLHRVRLMVDQGRQMLKKEEGVAAAKVFSSSRRLKSLKIHVNHA